MNQPACDISVIIPCHNAEAWIGDTVASATAQAGVDLEVILVDDGSTDRSVERAEQASASLRVIRQPNAGVSRARNVGTATARGRFIQYLDADDLLLPDTLQRQLDALTRSGADVAYCDWMRFDAQPDGSFRDGEVVRRALSQRPDHDVFLGAWWPVGALLYSRRTVDAILPWREDLPIIQDARFCLDAALTGARFVHVDHIGVWYRSHPNSLSRRDRKAFVDDCYRNAVDVHERWLREGPLDADRRRTLAVVYWSVARPFFQIDRTRFAEVVDRLRDLDPHFASLGPRRMQVVARIVGYPAAEHIAQYLARVEGDCSPVKILHAVYSAYPDPPGGTEIYVTTLCHELRRRGIQSSILAPGDRNESFAHNGIRIRKFAAHAAPTLEQLYGRDDPASAQRFAQVLEDETPDVVHQHALSPALSGELARQAKRRGLPVVFTYHTPTVSCQRGTLMERGTAQCDGRLDVARCAACTLEGLGASESASRLLARVPDVGGRLLGSLGLAGGPWTALRMSSLLALRHQELQALFEVVDRLVVLTPWVGEVLRANGVPDSKLVQSRHGIPQPLTDPVARQGDRATLRIAHLGRVDPGKGAPLLIEAVRALADADLALDVYGVVQAAAAGNLLEEVRRLAAGDHRVSFLPAIPSEDVVATISAYDLVAVPSQMMETGPLVVLEAFAAGVPVVASALGGLAEKIQDGINGLLVRPHDSVAAWRDAIDRCHRDRELIRRLARGISRPRSSADVATDMAELYSSLLSRQTPAPTALTGASSG